MVPFVSLVYGFLFALHSNYGPVLYRFRDKARCWSKSRFFHTLAFYAPVRGSRRNVVITFGMEKLEWRGSVKKFDDMFSRLDTTQYRRVTDRRTDRQTSCDSRVRAMHNIAR